MTQPLWVINYCILKIDFIYVCFSDNAWLHPFKSEEGLLDFAERNRCSFRWQGNTYTPQGIK